MMYSDFILILSSMEKLCECGCGCVVKSRFLKGHNRRGVTFTEEQKIKMSSIAKKRPPKSEEHRKNLSLSMKGKKHSVEHRRKITESRKDFSHSQEIKKLLSEDTKKKWEEGVFKDIGPKISKSKKGKKLSEKHKEALREAWKKRPPMSEETKNKLKKSFIDGNRVINTSNLYGIPTKYSGIQMRSKLEARYAKYLDSKGIKWFYEPERFWLKSLGCSYTPDFYLPELDTYVETKWDLEDPSLKKAYEFSKTGRKIIIVTDKEIPNPDSKET